MSKFYKHYKNKPYKYVGVVRHSETLEEMVLYETRYPNDLGKLWVRPKEMFHEDIELNGIRRARFAKVPVDYKFDQKISSEQIQLISNLLQKVFGSFRSEKISQKSNLLLITAWIENQMVGFKLGYARSPEIFYSWLGAVDPLFEDLGIGTELLKKQHQWCQENKFKIIETKTMNCWRGMIILNLNNGFEITGTEKNSQGELKILMQKKLSN